MHKYENMKHELEYASRQGIHLYLDGMPTSPEIIATRCVKEDGSYMADYVWDEGGDLKELRYDKIKKM